MFEEECFGRNQNLCTPSMLLWCCWCPLIGGFFPGCALKTEQLWIELRNGRNDWFLVFTSLLWYNMNSYYKILYCSHREIFPGLESRTRIAVSIVVIMKQITHKQKSKNCNKSQPQIIGHILHITHIAQPVIKKQHGIIAQLLQPRATLFKIWI